MKETTSVKKYYTDVYSFPLGLVKIHIRSRVVTVEGPRGIFIHSLIHLFELLDNIPMIS